MAARKGRQATRGGSKSWPAWVWVGIGLLLGVGLMLLVLFKDWAPLLRKKNLPQPNPAATAPQASEPAVADASKKEPPKKSYDFYKVLEANEVVIPDAELTEKARAEQQAKNAANATQGATAPAPGVAPATASGGRYILQAGSYPDAKGADEIKAKLALLGFQANVQPVTVNGKQWHRVRLGPYASASDLESAKRSLADNGINAIALKEQPPGQQ